MFGKLDTEMTEMREFMSDVMHKNEKEQEEGEKEEEEDEKEEVKEGGGQDYDNSDGPVKKIKVGRCRLNR